MNASTQYIVRDRETTETVFTGTVGEFIESLARYRSILHSNLLKPVSNRQRDMSSGRLRKTTMKQIEAVVGLPAWKTTGSGWTGLCEPKREADVETPFDRMVSQLEVAPA